MTDPESPEVHDSMTPEEMQTWFFNWALRFNLNNYVNFHNNLMTLLAEQRREPELSEDRAALSTLELYEKLTASTTLLLALAFFEEMLILFWRRVM